MKKIMCIIIFALSLWIIRFIGNIGLAVNVIPVGLCAVFGIYFLMLVFLSIP